MPGNRGSRGNGRCRIPVGPVRQAVFLRVGDQELFGSRVLAEGGIEPLDSAVFLMSTGLEEPTFNNEVGNGSSNQIGEELRADETSTESRLSAL